MSRGKYAAAAVHAALKAVDAHPNVPVIVLGSSPAKIKDLRVVIADAGRTEVAPGTITAGTDWETIKNSRTVIDDHRAIPGPLYWDFRCLVCSENVSDHSFWRWLWRKVRRR